MAVSWHYRGAHVFESKMKCQTQVADSSNIAPHSNQMANTSLALHYNTLWLRIHLISSVRGLSIFRLSRHPGISAISQTTSPHPETNLTDLYLLDPTRASLLDKPSNACTCPDVGIPTSQCLCIGTHRSYSGPHYYITHFRVPLQIICVGLQRRWPRLLSASRRSYGTLTLATC